ncbi:pectinesterase inhibitor 10-like [Triticum dicoccoides]|uniref:pectinesterase inhibitor 10-like n=1 Tax=Triticum dicoccoides TaxID=85692 RepID=UPI001891AECA|nr:pectinesterase inhibitor 10-like [Triticum dicoccoides]
MDARDAVSPSSNSSFEPCCIPSTETCRRPAGATLGNSKSVAAGLPPPPPELPLLARRSRIRPSRPSPPSLADAKPWRTPKTRCSASRLTRTSPRRLRSHLHQAPPPRIQPASSPASCQVPPRWSLLLAAASVKSAAAAVSLSNEQARTPAPSPACSIPCFRTESSNDAAAR